ncbi:hypothetical protein QBC45DRAFT_387719 [Copromyces sp. CBS 386.78]|nr:hypothetical protein QBC45DRAFT_387719 [Copromyces sp. CBS 386.78]
MHLKLKDLSITLPHKPTATLRISALFPGTSSPDFADSSSPDIAALPPSSTLLVFLNGLILPRSSWTECISRFLRIRDSHRRRSFESVSVPGSMSDNGIHLHLPLRAHENEIPKIPNILTYDRYGQGSSDPDPSDPDPSDPPPDPNTNDTTTTTPYGHTPLDVITDLHQLLLLVSRQFLYRNLQELDVVMVANSIGCPLARLFNVHFHSSVRVLGYLFLDSMMANSDFVSVFPDPDSPGFVRERDLKEGVHVSEEELRWARKMMRERFHPSVGNGERLDRRGLRGLLPGSDWPKLRLPVYDQDQTKWTESGTTTRKQITTRPKVIVIGHDWDVFADQNEKGPMSIPKAVINGYMNPAWQRYNEGLTRLAAVDGDGDDDNNVVPVKIARGCGHFIQKDDPELVAREVDSLLRRLGL